MNTLNFNVKGNICTQVAGLSPVSGENKYSQCVFTFDSEWDDVSIVTISMFFSAENVCSQAVEIKNKSCFASIPAELKNLYGTMYIGLLGVKSNNVIISTKIIPVKIEQGTIVQTTASTDIFLQLLQILENTTATIAEGAVTTDKIAYRAVTSDKIALSSITAEKIADGTVTNIKLAENAVNSPNLTSGAVTTEKIADSAILSRTISNNAITSPKLADGAVVGSKLEDSAVVGSKIADNAITSSKIATEQITTDKIRVLAVTTNKIADNAVTEQKLSNDVQIKLNYVPVFDSVISDTSTNAVQNKAVKAYVDGHIVTGDKIENGAVTGAKIAIGTITTNNISDGTITTNDLANGSVNASKVQDYSITTTKINDGAVTKLKLCEELQNDIDNIGVIGNNTVSTEKIVNGAVTTDKIALGTITTENISDGTITTNDLANGSVNASKLQDYSVITSKINDGSVTEMKLSDEVKAKLFTGLADGSVVLSKLSTALQTTINSIANKCDVVPLTDSVSALSTLDSLRDTTKTHVFFMIPPLSTTLGVTAGCLCVLNYYKNTQILNCINNNKQFKRVYSTVTSSWGNFVEFSNASKTYVDNAINTQIGNINTLLTSLNTQAQTLIDEAGGTV